MIVYKDKNFETNSKNPNGNWTNNDDVFVVNDSSELAKRISKNFPFFELVTDGDILIDIELWAQEKIDEYKETIEIYKEKSPLEVLQNENADLWFEIMIKNARATSQDRENAELWYEIMMGGKN